MCSMGRGKTFCVVELELEFWFGNCSELVHCTAMKKDKKRHKTSKQSWKFDFFYLIFKFFPASKSHSFDHSVLYVLCPFLAIWCGNVFTMISRGMIVLIIFVARFVNWQT